MRRPGRVAREGARSLQQRESSGRRIRAHLAVVVAAMLAAGAAQGDAQGDAPMTPQRERRGGPSALPLPLEIESSFSGQHAAGEVRGELAIGYQQMRQALTDPAAWCDFLTLHMNVKACVHGHHEATPYLRVFGGSKEFETLDAAQEIECIFRLDERSDARTQAVLRAADGPMGTSNYFIGVTLEPAGTTATAVHLVYRYELGFAARMALAAYLNTVARDKVGFSVIDSGADGAARYIGGVRGMVERNAVRYYLALMAYFDSVREGRFVPAAGARRWFDLTARYPTQLEEVSRDTYLDAKRREYAQQRAFQRSLDLQ